MTKENKKKREYQRIKNWRKNRCDAKKKADRKAARERQRRYRQNLGIEQKRIFKEKDRLRKAASRKKQKAEESKKNKNQMQTQKTSADERKVGTKLIIDLSKLTIKQKDELLAVLQKADFITAETTQHKPIDVVVATTTNDRVGVDATDVSDICAICQEDKPKLDSFIHSCKHEFHWSCAVKSLEIDSRCPLCSCQAVFLRDLNSVKCKKIEFKKRQLDEDQNLFPSFCEECLETAEGNDLTNCSWCAVILHECCSHFWNDQTLCSACFGEESFDVSEEDYFPADEQ